MFEICDSQYLSAPETCVIFLAVRVIALGQASFLGFFVCLFFSLISCLTLFALFKMYSARQFHPPS